jgi:hypothetical protein
MPLSLQGCLLITLFLLNISVSAGAVESDDALMQRLVEAHGKHTTAQGTLLWLTRNKADLAAAPRRQNVQFYLAFPERYHVIITKPNDLEYKLRFVSDGTTRWEAQQLFADEKPDRKTTLVGKEEAMEQQLMACFRFDLVSLRKDFTVVAKTNADGTHSVQLTPIAAELAKQLTTLTMYFNAQLALLRIISEDPQGNIFEFQVDSVAFDKAIDPAYFRVGP